MQILIRFMAVPLILLAIAILPFIGRAVLGPVSRAAGLLKAPTRFQLSDFVWLLVIIQAALAAVVRFVGVETRGHFEAILMYLIFAGFALWCGAISFLSRAGVRDPYRRAAFILFILPGTLALMIGIPAGAMLTLSALAKQFMNFGGWHLRPDDVAIFTVAVIAAVVLLPAVIIGMRKASYWVVQEAELEAVLPGKRQNVSDFSP